jgi:hypothetical protein
VGGHHGIGGNELGDFHIYLKFLNSFDAVNAIDGDNPLSIGNSEPFFAEGRMWGLMLLMPLISGTFALQGKG